MVFRIIALFNILAISFVAALDYEFTAPNAQTQTPPQLNSIANDTNSLSAATSAATSVGYDYTPQMMQSPATEPSELLVEQQQFTVAAPIEYWPPAKYEYSYGVSDAYTGDIKSHSESRDGNFVRGEYSVVDPDGYERIVSYTADDINGFRAVIHRRLYISNILKSNQVVKPNQKEDASPTVNTMQDNKHVDTIAEQHGSYVTPLLQHQTDAAYDS